MLSFARHAQALMLGSVLAFSGLICEPVHAGEASLARQLAERMVSEESLIAVTLASIDEVRRQTRDALGKMFDLSSVTDRDLDVFIRVQTELNAKGVAAGLRRVLAIKLEELPEKDLEIWLSCLNMLACERDKFSPETMAFAQNLPAFGKSKGQEIGQAVGTATARQLLKKLKSMDESEFDNRDELIRVMSKQISRT